MKKLLAAHNAKKARIAVLAAGLAASKSSDSKKTVRIGLVPVKV